MNSIKFLSLFLIVLCSCDPKEEDILCPADQNNFELFGDLFLNGKDYNLVPSYLDNDIGLTFELGYCVDGVERLQVSGSRLIINDSNYFTSNSQSSYLAIFIGHDELISNIFSTKYDNPKSWVYIEQIDSNSYKIDINAYLICIKGFPECRLVDDPPIDTVLVESQMIFTRL